MTTLTNTLPELRSAYAKLSQLAAAQGIAFQVADFGGHRTAADTATILQYRDQDYAVYVRNLKANNPGAVPMSKERWRPIADYGHSYHDYGAAFDIVITRAPAGLSSSAARARVGALAAQAGLRWGHSFGDDPHFQLTISLDDARRRWQAFQAAQPNGGAALWGLVALVAIGAGVVYGLRHAGGLAVWQ